MGYSMTGYGRSEITQDNKQILVEIKSLNGKNLDTTLKIPATLKGFENDIRTLVNTALLRGTVECKVEWKQNGVARPVTIHKELVQALYIEAQALAQTLGATDAHLFSALLQLPEAFQSTAEAMDESAWPLIEQALREAIEQLQQHRATEGASLMQDLRERIENIQQGQKEIAPLEPLRRQRIRERITQAINDFFGSEKIDHNRLEQELIYYVEKIDFSEEQVRLEEHCRYFLDVLGSEDMLKGKKLGFILQEIGREINTLGSKANDAAIQKTVINMKDELEKAKEQVLNLL